MLDGLRDNIELIENATKGIRAVGEGVSDLRKEALNVMKQGGLRIVEDAKAKWRRGDYNDIPAEPMIEHWDAIDAEIRSIARDD
jgi:hypothetical protein